MMFPDLSMLIEMDKKSNTNLKKNYVIDTVKIKKNIYINKNFIKINKEYTNNDMWYIFASE